MEEKKIQIPTTDNKIIYGTLNSNNNETLAIFVHSIPGNENIKPIKNTKDQFPKYGIDTFRFNLYSEENNSRQIEETDIKTHINDLDEVVKHYKEEYEQIVIIGFELGATITLFSKQDVEAIILWNPSCEANEEIKNKTNKETIESIKELKLKIDTEQFNIPTRIIVGSKTKTEEEWKTKEIKENKNVEGKLIEGAGRFFEEEKTEIKLYARTIEFIHEQTRE